MKMRNGFVSNSSSSSFIIECKGKELAEYVAECYSKLVDYWMSINPNDNGYGIDREGFKLVSIDEIEKHFENYWMEKNEIKILKKDFEKEKKEGYVFLLGCCDSEDGTSEDHLMYMFIEDILNYLQKNVSEYLDINLIFERRWS